MSPTYTPHYTTFFPQVNSNSGENLDCLLGPIRVDYKVENDPGLGMVDLSVGSNRIQIGVRIMAKKKPAVPKGKSMPIAAEERGTGHAKLELPRKDYERLRAVADARGLSISAYIRQAVLLAIKADEEGLA